MQVYQLNLSDDPLITQDTLQCAYIHLWLLGLFIKKMWKKKCTCYKLGVDCPATWLNFILAWGYVLCTATFICPGPGNNTLLTHPTLFPPSCTIFKNHFTYISWNMNLYWQLPGHPPLFFDGVSWKRKAGKRITCQKT